MSEGMRTRLRKRRQSEPFHSQSGKAKREAKKSKTIVSALLNEPPETCDSERPGASTIQEHESDAIIPKDDVDNATNTEKIVGMRAICTNTGSDDTRGYESSPNQQEETSKGNIGVEDLQKFSTNEEKYKETRSCAKNCKLLSKLLSDVNEQVCHVEWQSEKSTDKSLSEHDEVETDEVSCQRSLTAKQQVTSFQITPERKGVPLCCDHTDTPLRNETLKNNTITNKQEARSTTRDKHHKTVTQAPGYNSINVTKRNNPHLIELINQDDSTSSGQEQIVKTSCDSTCKQPTTGKIGVVKSESKEENCKEMLDSYDTELVSNQKPTSAEDDACNDVEELGNRSVDPCTKKTSIRLRRRSGDTWAVRYEKDFVVTPLAKLSKDDATILPARGIDAAVFSQEELCSGLGSRSDGSFVENDACDGNFVTPSTSQKKEKSRIPYKKRKYRKKYSYKQKTNKKGVYKRRSLCASSVEPTGNSSPVELCGAAALSIGEAVALPGTSSNEEQRSAPQAKESRRSTRSAPLIENLTGFCTRRQTELGVELLTDSRLARHACALWSSENRRHFQLTHPEASGGLLDNLMRSAWEQLASKEKLKYVHRARNAMKDRNKHSSHASTNDTRNTDRAKTQIGHQEDKFHTLSPDHQLVTLRNKMKYFQNFLSPEEYRNFLQEFRTALRSTVHESMHLYCEQRSRKFSSDLESISRRMLYNKIKDYEPKVEERRRNRFAQLKKEYERRFQNLVMDILNDERVFDTEFEDCALEGDVKPENKEDFDELGWIIEKLTDIESDEDAEWSEDDKNNIKQLAVELKEMAKVSTSSFQIEKQTVKVPAISNELYEMKLLQDSCTIKVLPELSVDDINHAISAGASAPPTTEVSLRYVKSEESLNRNYQISPPSFPRPRAPPHLTFHDYVLSSSACPDEHVVESCCELDSPSCLLTTALVSERLEQQQLLKVKEKFKRILRPTQHQT